MAEAKLFETAMPVLGSTYRISAGIGSTVGDGTFNITMLTRVSHPQDDLGLESLEINVIASIRNPVILSCVTSYLAGFGLCFAPKAFGIMSEAIVLSYSDTKSENPAGFVSLRERHHEMFDNLLSQRDRIQAKLVGALSQCIYPFK